MQAGRWKPAPEKVPDYVAEHYLRLPVYELIEDVLRHYRVNVWPKVEAMVASHSNDTSRYQDSTGGVGPMARLRDRPGLLKGRCNMAYGQ